MLAEGWLWRKIVVWSSSVVRGGLELLELRMVTVHRSLWRGSRRHHFCSYAQSLKQSGAKVCSLRGPNQVLHELAFPGAVATIWQSWRGAGLEEREAIT
ncbi:hypothetical protein SESBI_27436 [Sesbania bispinosa]|nr:hypothetical protein SESBI_27436 [Sesbania bispinosa]